MGEQTGEKLAQAVTDKELKEAALDLYGEPTIYN